MEVVAKLVIICLLMLSFCVNVAKCGEPEGRIYGSTTFFVSFAVSMVLYYFAGIFNILK